ncbi:hypothetical protein [Campylobacter troglodytis]|uniref:hypothetical protein n=1 Tax=Campylobacter troglodytis TaxID=654363 RepID=UPI00115887DA|nr:hypothetical protein [Campylobacter troglodytis]TQR58602.1 hypothetical protein DMC01_07735 [Campylobacter troglodytis]
MIFNKADLNLYEALNLEAIFKQTVSNLQTAFNPQSFLILQTVPQVLLNLLTLFNAKLLALANERGGGGGIPTPRLNLV